MIVPPGWGGDSLPCEHDVKQRVACLQGEFGQVSGAVWRTRELEHLSVVLRKLQKPVLESEEVSD